MSYPVVYTPEPTQPAKGPRPGTRRLYDFIAGEFDVAVHGDEIHGLGIYNPRDVCGNPWPKWKCKGSQHARGAAGDSGLPVVRPKGHPEGHRLADWLVLHHAALGIQEVIWAGRRWDNQSKAWRKYTGRSDHFDHVHWAQTAQAADQLTVAQIQEVWLRHPAPPDVVPQEDDDMKIIVPTGPGVEPKHLDKNFLCGNGTPVMIEDPRQLTGLQKIYGPQHFVDSLTWDVIRSTGKPRV